MIVVFDVAGTLFSFQKIKTGCRDKGIPPGLIDLWLDRIVQCASTSALTGQYVPFTVLAQGALRQMFGLENIDTEHFEEVLKSLTEIDPWEDAEPCLQCLRSNGHKLVALSNSSLEDTEYLLSRSGLRKNFEALYSAESAKAYKPHPAPYEFVLRNFQAAPSDFCMVSAHEWDILGARSAGMRTVYVNRLNKVWPFPGPSGSMVSSLEEVNDAIAGQFEDFLIKLYHEF